jgi:hypothetical protein
LRAVTNRRQDILAWVTESNERYLSLATLDALLTIRHDEGSRVVNLKTLLTTTFDALFTFSQPAASGALRNKEAVETRLGVASSAFGDSNIIADGASADELDAYQAELAEHFKPKQEAGALQRALSDLGNTGVRLADNLVDRLSVVTDALGAGNLAMKRLLGCLKAMCNPLEAINQDAAIEANQHCARNIAEYLLECKVDDIEASKTREIVRLLLRLLREDQLIDRWIKYSGEDHAVTLLPPNAFADALITWFKSPDIQGRLPKEHLDWIELAEMSPTKTLFEGLAKGHARKWLTQRSSNWIGPNFDFINIYRAKTNLRPVGSTSSSEEPVAANLNDTTDSSSDGQNLPPPKGLQESSADDILKVARWANLREDSTWHGSVGYAYWAVDKNDDAIAQYSEALEQDESEPTHHKFIASSYLGLYQQGKERPAMGNLAELTIAHYSRAVALYISQTTDQGSSDGERDEAERELINTRLSLAGAYSTAKNAAKSDEIYQDVVKDWNNRTVKDGQGILLGFAAFQYLHTLIQQGNDDDAISFLESTIHHSQSRDREYQRFLSQLTNLADAIMKLAYRNKRLDLLLNFWRRASIVTACYGYDFQVFLVQYSYATAIIRFIPDRKNHACRLLKLIRNDKNADNWQYVQAERALARTYLTTALEAMDKEEWDRVGRCSQALRELTLHDDRAYKCDEAAVFVASWYTQLRRPVFARDAVKQFFQSRYSLLLDSEPDNDQEAWYDLGNAAVAVGDEDRAVAAFNKCGFITSREVEAGAVTDTVLDVKAESEHEEEQGPDLGGGEEAGEGGGGGREVEGDAQLVASSKEIAEESRSSTQPTLVEAATMETSTSSKTSTSDIAASRSIGDDGSMNAPEDRVGTKLTVNVNLAAPNGTEDITQSLSKTALAPIAHGTYETNEGGHDDGSTVSREASLGGKVAASVSPASLDGEASATESAAEEASASTNDDPVGTTGPTASGTENPKSSNADNNDATAPESDATKASPVCRYICCDGPCADDRIFTHQPVHRCKICLVDFCEECYGLMRRDGMPDFALCSSKHDWLTIGAYRRCPDDSIIYRGEEMSLQDWLEDFAEEYGLERVVREPAAEGEAVLVAEEGTAGAGG